MYFVCNNGLAIAEFTGLIEQCYTKYHRLFGLSWIGHRTSAVQISFVVWLYIQVMEHNENCNSNTHRNVPTSSCWLNLHKGKQFSFFNVVIYNNDINICLSISPFPPRLGTDWIFNFFGKPLKLFPSLFTCFAYVREKCLAAMLVALG